MVVIQQLSSEEPTFSCRHLPAMPDGGHSAGMASTSNRMASCAHGLGNNNKLIRSCSIFGPIGRLHRGRGRQFAVKGVKELPLTAPVLQDSELGDSGGRCAAVYHPTSGRKVRASEDPKRRTSRLMMRSLTSLGHTQAAHSVLPIKVWQQHSMRFHLGCLPVLVPSVQVGNTTNPLGAVAAPAAIMVSVMAGTVPGL